MSPPLAKVLPRKGFSRHHGFESTLLRQPVIRTVRDRRVFSSPHSGATMPMSSSVCIAIAFAAFAFLLATRVARNASTI